MIDRYVSPKELRRLISALVVVVTFILINAFFGFLILPAARMATKAPADPMLKTPEGQTGWLDPSEFPLEASRVIPPIDPATVMEPNPELLKRGKALYDQTCAACHGAEGQGDGPAAAGLPTKPRVFAQAAGWKHSAHRDGLWQTLEEGLPGTSMQAYSYLSKKDRMALVHHVRTLATFDKGVENPAAVTALAKVFASAGEVIPNRIPVSRAIRLLASEAPAPHALRLEGPSALLVRDPLRAAQTLEGLQGWKDNEKLLAESLVKGLPANGFSPAIATLGPVQWKAFRADLAAASAR